MRKQQATGTRAHYEFRIHWSQYQGALAQRNLYPSPLLDAKILLLLDRISIYQVYEYEDRHFWIKVKRMELLLDPNSEECFRLEARTHFRGVSVVYRRIFIDYEDRASNNRYTVDFEVSGYLLKKICLEDLMTTEGILTFSF